MEFWSTGGRGAVEWSLMQRDLLFDICDEGKSTLPVFSHAYADKAYTICVMPLDSK